MIMASRDSAIVGFQVTFFPLFGPSLIVKDTVRAFGGSKLMKVRS